MVYYRVREKIFLGAAIIVSVSQGNAAFRFFQSLAEYMQLYVALEISP